MRGRQPSLDILMQASLATAASSWSLYLPCLFVRKRPVQVQASSLNIYACATPVRHAIKVSVLAVEHQSSQCRGAAYTLRMGVRDSADQSDTTLYCVYIIRISDFDFSTSLPPKTQTPYPHDLRAVAQYDYSYVYHRYSILHTVIDNSNHMDCSSMHDQVGFFAALSPASYVKYAPSMLKAILKDIRGLMQQRK